MINKITGQKKVALYESIAGFIFVFPTVAIFLVFLYYPFLNGVMISFFEFSGIGALGDFVGLQNYKDIFSDARFLRSFINTIVFIAINLVVIYPVSFILAYILYVGVPFSNVFQFFLFVPYILSTVVVGTLWSIILDPTIGPINNFLKAIGLESLAHTWLGSQETSLFSVSMVGIWKVIPFYMIILYANLLKIPKDLLEAAEIDGARYFQKIIYVILPCMNSTFSAIFLLIITGAFRFFDLIWIMTMGGPGGASEVVATYIYRRAFQNNDFGYSTAVSIFVVIVLMVFLLIYNAIQKRSKND